MRVAEVYYNRIPAGKLKEENRNSYTFIYYDDYYKDQEMPSISLTLPKTQKGHQSNYLFPFFYNMLSEGVNKTLQSRQLQIDEDDSFGLLLATAGSNTIGAITIKPIES
ncbi:MAG: HipA N-terminal domain-containing protein [Daejeonella sp.]|uniref:HipA N-terminal domain-containing protein n=1 Tax=Daejeonella sp. TaxID=2805397 RepID=UPI003C725E5C